MTKIDKKFISEKDKIRAFQLHILATFLWSDDLQIDKKDSFILQPEYFDSDLKEIAKLINISTTEDGKYYGFLNTSIENIYPVQWLSISEITPVSFSFANKYYTELSKYQIAKSLKE